MKLKIVAPRMSGMGSDIYLDDKRIERVTDVKVEMVYDEINRATISFYPTELEIEGEFVVEQMAATPREEPK